MQNYILFKGLNILINLVFKVLLVVSLHNSTLYASFGLQDDNESGYKPLLELIRTELNIKIN